MPEKPPYDPSKIVSSGVEHANSIQASSDKPKPKYDPKRMVKKGVEAGYVEPNYDFDPSLNSSEDKVDSAISFLKKQYGNGNTSDTDFDALRNVLSDERATNDQRKMAIDAIQKKSMNNEKYAFELQKNGVSVPKSIPYGEKPKDMETLQSLWGSQDKANDDNVVTDVAKHIFNILPSIGQQAVGLVQLGHEAIFDEESKGLNELSKAAESLKFKTDEDLKGGLYDFSNVKSYRDLANLENFDLRPEKIWGTALQLGQTVGEMMIPAGQIMEGIKGAKWAYNIAEGGEKVLSTAGKVATAGVSSFLVNAPEVADAADKAGLKGRDKALFVSTVGAAISSIDVKIGIGSKIADVIGAKALNKEASEDFLVNAAKKAIVNNADGTVSKESLDQAISETIKEYPKNVSSWIANAAKGANIQGVEEVGQAVIQKAGEQAWDKLSPETKAKFGTDMFSPKSIGEYISNYTGALVGGGVGSVVLGNEIENEKKKYFEQSKVVYNAVKKGDDAVTNLTNNLKAAVDNGSITPEQYETAVFKVKAYQKYDEQTKDLNLDDKQKQEAFKLSFNIEALKSEVDIPAEDLAKLDPIAHAKINTKKKLAKGLQEELDKIILKENIQTETKTAQKNVDEVFKDIEPKEEKPKSVKQLIKTLGEMTAKPAEKVGLQPEIKDEDKGVDFEVDNIRSMDRSPVEKFTTLGWNKMAETNPTRVKAIVQEKLKKEPNNQMKVIVRSGKNQTLTFDIGDNKQVKSAQSRAMGEKDYFKYKNLPEKRINVVDRGGNPVLDEAGEPEFYYEEPVIMKRLDFDSKDREGNPMRKGVVAVYNEKSGELISFIREHRKGKSVSSEADKYHLQKIYNSNLYDEATMAKYSYKPKEAAVEPAPKPKETAPKEAPVNYTRLAKKAESERELDAIIDQADKAGADIDIDVVAKRRESLKPKVEVKVKKPTLKLNLITDAKSLDRKIEKTYKGRATKTKVKNEQVKIEKKFENLKQLLDCIHG